MHDRPMTTVSEGRTMTGWTRLDALALAAVVLVAAAIRLLGLSRPTELVFDEIFYARDACWYVFASESVCGISDLASRSHPPLGKWLVASGIAAFGYVPFGWRIGVAVAGTLTVALVHLLAWQLLRGRVPGTAATVGAFAASGLLATDLLHVVHSRVGMLDAFIVLFVVGAVVAVVLDRDRPRGDPDAAAGWQRLALGRPWRMVAGACIGAAAAVKWSGAYVAPAVIGLVVAWEIAAERRRVPDAGWRRWVGGAVRREALPTFVLLGIVPILVYVASYTGRMPGELVGLPWVEGTVWRGIWEHQRAMLEFHTQLAGSHPYQSSALAWPLLQRPVAYWFGTDGGAYREILAMGNPAVWWPGIVALGALGVTWARAGWGVVRPEPVVLGAAVSTFLPWLILSGDRDQTFLWYFLPTVPFLTIALGTLVAWAWSWSWSRAGGLVAGRAAAIAFGLVAIGSFAFWAPLAVALPLEPDAWRTRILFADCERPDGSVPELPDDSTSSGEPPSGWCWI